MCIIVFLLGLFFFSQVYSISYQQRFFQHSICSSAHFSEITHIYFALNKLLNCFLLIKLVAESCFYYAFERYHVLMYLFLVYRLSTEIIKFFCLTKADIFLMKQLPQLAVHILYMFFRFMHFLLPLPFFRCWIHLFMKDDGVKIIRHDVGFGKCKPRNYLKIWCEAEFLISFVTFLMRCFLHLSKHNKAFCIYTYLTFRWQVSSFPIFQNESGLLGNIFGLWHFLLLLLAGKYTFFFILNTPAIHRAVFSASHPQSKIKNPVIIVPAAYDATDRNSSVYALYAGRTAAHRLVYLALQGTCFPRRAPRWISSYHLSSYHFFICYLVCKQLWRLFFCIVIPRCCLILVATLFISVYLLFLCSAWLGGVIFFFTATVLKIFARCLCQLLGILTL